jgi:hypothetical protein
LGGGTLEEVVNGGAYNDAVLLGVNGEATDFNAVAASNILDNGWLADDLHKLLASIAVLVDVADVTRGHGLFERNVDGQLKIG